MEKTERIKPIMTLTNIENPLKAQYITQDSIAINCNWACKIIHTNTNTIIDIALKYGSRIQYAGIQKNNNKIAFSSQNSINKTDLTSNLCGIMVQNIIDIYDTNNGELLHTIMAKNAPQCPIFSSLDNVVLLGYTKWNNIVREYGYIIEKYNYKENCYTEHSFSNPAPFACHPTKQQVCVACNFQKPAIYSIDNFSVIKTMPLSDLMAHTNSYTLCEYSPNGSFIATGNDMFLYIWNLRTEKASMLPVVERENIQKIAFHPNNIILTLLSLNHHSCSIIRYWDLLTRKPIKEMQPLKGIGLDLSFSPDGKKIVVAFNNRCVIYPVPHEVINPEEVS